MITRRELLKRSGALGVGAALGQGVPVVFAQGKKSVLTIALPSTPETIAPHQFRSVLTGSVLGCRCEGLITRDARTMELRPVLAESWRNITILLAITVVAVLGPGARNVVITLSVTGWTVYARLIRGETLAVKGRDFVDAARAAGAGDLRVMVRHVLPNVLSPVIVVAVFAVANMIVLEATLSFLGLGVEPRVPTWGGMLNSGRLYLRTAWWLTPFPGLAIFVTVLAVNLLGDWLRDWLDPRLRHVV